MIKTNGIIRLNVNETILFENPEIEITTDIKYNDKWEISVCAKFKAEYVGEISKIYKIPPEYFYKFECSNNFLGKLNLLIESFVLSDLQLINPMAKFMII